MGGVCTYALSLTHLMKVGPSSNNDDLGIAWVAQVCCQLPLPRPVPAHVKEYLDDDEYYDNSVKGKKKPVLVNNIVQYSCVSLNRFDQL